MMKEMTVEDVNQVLYKCFDPEIPVNVMDLGLIYDVKITGKNVHVIMTLTARGCPMHNVISNDITQKIEQLDTVEKAEVEIVWEPQWTPSMISPAGRKALGME